MDRTRVVAGLLLIAVGGLFAVDALGWWETGEVVTRWWPLALVAVGALRILNRPPDYGGGIVMIVIGVVLLDGTAGIWPGNAAELIWPLVLIGVGTMLIVRQRQHQAVSTDESVQLTAIFSGRKAVCSANPFRSAFALAAFGGIDLDLRPAVIEREGAVVDATALFGGVKLIVPTDWKVVLSGPAIFGGNENKTELLGPLPPDAPVLRVRSFALFGGVEVEAQPVRRSDDYQAADGAGVPQQV